MKTCYFITYCLLILHCFGCSDFNESGTNVIPEVFCQKTLSDVQIDGRDDESGWKTASVLEMANNSGATAGQKPPLRASARTMWDNKNLYILYTFEDHNIRVDYHKHDDPMWNSKEGLEVAEVMFDPDGKGRRYFEINVNPDGIVLDVLIVWKDGEPTFDVDWDAEGLMVATHLLDAAMDGMEGWAVEMAIPWKSVECNTPRPGDVRRINLYRGEGDFEIPHLSWSQSGSASYHVPQRFGKMIFK